MQPVIRDARAADETLLYGFICELEESELPREAFGIVWKQCLADPYIKYLIAEQDGTPVGMGSCSVRPLLHHAGLVAEIEELYVVPAGRSFGTGALLLERLVAFAEEKGAIQVEVASNKRRVQAHRFYEREGFRNSHFKLTRPLQPALNGLTQEK